MSDDITKDKYIPLRMHKRSQDYQSFGGTHAPPVPHYIQRLIDGEWYNGREIPRIKSGKYLTMPQIRDVGDRVMKHVTAGMSLTNARIAAGLELRKEWENAL